MKKYTILVVDDDPDIVSSTSLILEKSGYDVVVAYTGKEALEAVADKPDLILLDLMLPDIEGYEVADKIKSNPLYKNIPIVILSARGQDIDKYVAAKKGAVGYINKPFEVSNLLFTIKDVLEGHP